MGAHITDYEAECLMTLLELVDRGTLRGFFDSGEDLTVEQMQILQRIGEPSDTYLKAYYDAILRSDKLKSMKVDGRCPGIDDDSAQVFTLRDTDGNAVVLFEGTQSGDDIWADIELGVGGEPTGRLAIIIDYIRGLGSDVELTGHSLGGHLAMVVACLCPNVSIAVAINAPGLSVHTKEVLEEHGLFDTSKIRTVNNPDDTVHNINNGGGPISSALGAFGEAHRVSRLASVFSSATQVRDFRPEKEKEILDKLGEIKTCKPDETQTRGFFATLISGIVSFFEDVLNWLSGQTGKAFDNVASEILETEQEVQKYFAEGREIDQRFGETVASSDLLESIRTIFEEVKELTPRLSGPICK